MAIESFLFSFSALIATTAITLKTRSSRIDLSIVRLLQNQSDKHYPADEWVPQTWFKAVAQLDFVDPVQKEYVQGSLWYMDGWSANLAPLAVLGAVVAWKAVDEWRFCRTLDEREGGQEKPSSDTWGRAEEGRADVETVTEAPQLKREITVTEVEV